MMVKSSGVSVFIFAHQDDELGVFAKIDAVIARGGRPLCLYLTDGGAARSAPRVRNAESAAVMRRLGVPAKDLHFIGTEQEIPDGDLVSYLSRAYAAVIGICSAYGKIEELVMHAWEGGHQDHDAAHLVGLAVARHFGIIEQSSQFALYRRNPNSPLPFVMFQPIEANGPVTQIRIAPYRRLHYVKFLSVYRSQRKTMLGLLPMILWHYLTSGKQQLQPVGDIALDKAPHSEPLLYEKRSKATWEQFSRISHAFSNEHGLLGCRKVPRFARDGNEN